ncbi:MAG: chromosomal replication initiator protein DnaA [Deltaproteobacteria bacterium]|nr:chromosomal replication initiator protein DnaA [Deltaproteobacteria bacterium]
MATELFTKENHDPVSSGEVLITKETVVQPSSDASKVWEYIRNEIRSHIDDHQYIKFIHPVKVLPSNKDELVLVVPSMNFYQILLNDFLELIERCKNRLGFEHLSIIIDLEGNKESNSSQNALQPSKGSENEVPSDEIADTDLLFSETLSRKTRLNPNYCFETYVRGPSNQFALAACNSVADHPGSSYNPLFIFGATGLGKTHLLHAVGNKIAKQHPEKTITYISSERFMNELIYCLRHNKIIDFRQKYRLCDLFLMDDIQFISGNKTATQEEFFHTFNTLYERKKQIIITSDLFPQDIPDIEERLRNRFQWGLIADIQPPEIEHRIAILYSKAHQLGITLSAEVAEYIAGIVKRNVRELEGALHRLAAFAALQGRVLNMHLAIETFSNMVRVDEQSKPEMIMDAVQKAVAEHFQIKVSDLRSRRRQKAFTLPRQVAMYLCRQFANMSFTEIGERFGGKDHSTVMHAVRKITLERKRSTGLTGHLEALERCLGRIK